MAILYSQRKNSVNVLKQDSYGNDNNEWCHSQNNQQCCRVWNNEYSNRIN